MQRAGLDGGIDLLRGAGSRKVEAEDFLGKKKKRTDNATTLEVESDVWYVRFITTHSNAAWDNWEEWAI